MRKGGRGGTREETCQLALHLFVPHHLLVPGISALLQRLRLRLHLRVPREQVLHRRILGCSLRTTRKRRLW